MFAIFYCDVWHSRSSMRFQKSVKTISQLRKFIRIGVRNGDISLNENEDVINSIDINNYQSFLNYIYIETN